MRKFDLTDPVHRVGQSLVYYDQLDSMVEKCRSMQGIKGIDGTVVFADRVQEEAEGDLEPNCSLGIVLKPEELTFTDKGEVGPVLAGSLSKAFADYDVDLRWPYDFLRKGKSFGQMKCVISKIKDRWVYVIVILHFHFDDNWDQTSQEAFLQAVLAGLDQGDQAMRKGQVEACRVAYGAATGLMNRRVRTTEENRVLEGRVVDIEPKGDLLIKPEKGRTSKAAGNKVKTLEYLDVASE